MMQLYTRKRLVNGVGLYYTTPHSGSFCQLELGIFVSDSSILIISMQGEEVDTYLEVDLVRFPQSEQNGIDIDIYIVTQ